MCLIYSSSSNHAAATLAGTYLLFRPYALQQQQMSKTDERILYSQRDELRQQVCVFASVSACIQTGTCPACPLSVVHAPAL